MNDILQKIAAIAWKDKYEIYAVGGYVRDLLLKKQVKDIDFVILGSGVEFAQKVRHNLKPSTIVIFERFGTAMIQYQDYQLEFVGARSESYSPDSRKPTVTTASLEADLSRRDFTINTLAMSLNLNNYGEIIDPFNGRADLKQRIIKTPLEPEITFHDDPLRVLRAIRFATQLHFKIEPTTLAALAKMAERLKIISQERISDELMKILAARKPSIGLKLMSETGVLAIIFPELEALKGVDQRGQYHHKDVLNHTIQVVDNVAKMTDDIKLRFAALVHDIGKAQTKAFKEGIGWTFHGHDEVGARMLPALCQRLKLPNEVMKYTQKLVRLHLRPIALAEEEVTDSAIRRLMAHAGEHIDDLITLCRADITSGNPQRVAQHLANFDRVVQRMQAVEEKDSLRAFQSPVRGDEIMEVCQLKPGPKVGKLKKMIEEAILDGVIRFEHDAALEYLLAHKDEILKAGETDKNLSGGK